MLGNRFAISPSPVLFVYRFGHRVYNDGGLLTATARFTPRVAVVFVTRVVAVVVTRIAFLVSCIENGCNFGSLFEMLITSRSSLSEIAPERLTFSAR